MLSLKTRVGLVAEVDRRRFAEGLGGLEGRLAAVRPLLEPDVDLRALVGGQEVVAVAATGSLLDRDRGRADDRADLGRGEVGAGLAGEDRGRRLSRGCCSRPGGPDRARAAGLRRARNSRRWRRRRAMRRARETCKRHQWRLLWGAGVCQRARDAQASAAAPGAGARRRRESALQPARRLQPDGEPCQKGRGDDRDDDPDQRALERLLPESEDADAPAHDDPVREVDRDDVGAPAVQEGEGAIRADVPDHEVAAPEPDQDEARDGDEVRRRHPPIGGHVECGRRDHEERHAGGTHRGAQQRPPSEDPDARSADLPGRLAGPRHRGPVDRADEWECDPRNDRVVDVRRTPEDRRQRAVEERRPELQATNEGPGHDDDRREREPDPAGPAAEHSERRDPDQ